MRKTIVIYSGPSFERWDFRTINTSGIGGSETWLVYLSREFSKLNYRVIVFADCPESGIKDDNVTWFHYSKYPEWIDYNWIDFFISSRTTDTFNFPVRAGKKLVMIHDIWLSRDSNYNTYQDKIDYYLCLSSEHKKFVANHHKILEDKILITANGLDFSRFEQKVEKKHFKCIYSSSPDRGLENLLYLFPFIKMNVPEAELHIFYGFNNLLKALELQNDENKKNWVNKLLETIKTTEGVFNHGRVSQLELAKEFLESSVLLYPSSFEETFCITALEAMAAGCVVLSSNYWGLKDTVKDAGILLDIQNSQETYAKEYREKYAIEAIKLLKDREYLSSFQEKGHDRVKRFSWSNVALQFDKFFTSGIWEQLQ